jgi:hypothetical protein
MDNLLNDSLDALRRAQPTWRADALGVRGNPIEFHKQQARVDWPDPTLTHRGQGVSQAESTPGAPAETTERPAT